MNFSRILRFGAVGVALILTVPLKLTVVPERLNHNFEDAAAGLLISAGFEIRVDNRFGYFVITAIQNDCRLQLRDLAASGFNVEQMEADSPSNAQIAFEYRGKLWRNHPTLRATISDLWSRLKWQLGVDGSWWPVLLIASVGPCPIETMPWDKIATIQAY